MPSILYIGQLAKILISATGGILKKISYERQEYESVDEKSLSWAMSQKKIIQAQMG